MKFRLFSLILTLSMVGWTQDAPSGQAKPNSTPKAQAQGCCHHNMAAKESKSCCHHDATDAKDAAPCCDMGKCEMKGGKSCSDGKDATAAMAECKKNGCCADKKCCEDGKSCGGTKSEKTAKSCCANKCEHQSPTVAGN